MRDLKKCNWSKVLTQDRQACFDDDDAEEEEEDDDDFQVVQVGQHYSDEII